MAIITDKAHHRLWCNFHVKEASITALVISQLIGIFIYSQFSDYEKRNYYYYLVPVVLVISTLIALLGHLIRVRALQYPFLVVNAIFIIGLIICLGIFVKTALIDGSQGISFNLNGGNAYIALQCILFLLWALWSQLVVFNAIKFINRRTYNPTRTSDNDIPYADEH
ncbi:hypothetical protein Ddc_13616 [Ditylenchus destructor]|nr:hypothetical protein Ddc_13616 [Ditylenchus destructor]